MHVCEGPRALWATVTSSLISPAPQFESRCGYSCPSRWETEAQDPTTGKQWGWDWSRFCDSKAEGGQWRLRVAVDMEVAQGYLAPLAAGSDTAAWGTSGCRQVAPNHSGP